MSIRSSLNIVLSALLSGLLGYSVLASADDTEIYLNTSSSQGSANILFNLDTSGSMSRPVDENNNGVIDSGERSRIEVLREAMLTVLDSLPAFNAGIMRYHRRGGPILYPVAPLNQEACIFEGTCTAATSVGGIQTITSTLSGDDDAVQIASAVTLNGSSLGIGYQAGGGSCTDVSNTVRIATGTDDIEEDLTGGSVDSGSTDLEIPREGSTQQIIGLRFLGIPIPFGVTVTDARIEFEIDDTGGSGYNSSIHTLIWGEATSGSRGAFADDGKPSTRTPTSTIVDWETGEFPGVDESFTTPNLSGILTEIVGTTGWASGQDMVLMITDDPSTNDSGSRETESYNGEPSAAPLLTYTYTDCSGTIAAEMQTGLRFQNVYVPHGSTITSARIDLIATAPDSGTPTLRVKIEDADDAAPLTTSAFSTRSFVSSSEDWNAASTPALEDPWVVDTTYPTPDLTSQVQQVVNRSGWCGGNAMMFMLERNTSTANAMRNAYSSEGDSSKSPVLTITYDEDTPQASANGCITSTIIRSVSASSDDAEERVATGTMESLTSSDLEMVLDSVDQVVGVRFTELPIPQGAIIDSAKLIFSVDESHSGATSLVISGQASDDAVTFSGSTNNITSTSTRPKTTATVNWSPAAFGAFGTTHDSPDLKTIIQEIVNQAGWTPGNAMALFVSGSGKRVAISYDGDPASAVRLEITFEGTPSTAKTTVRSKLKNIVAGLTQRGGTPILGSMVEAAYYFRGEPVHFGLQRGEQSSSDRVTRLSHLSSYNPNGSTVVYPSGCTDADLNNSACVNQVISGGTPRYKSPIIAECQSNYLINLTDGGGYFTYDEEARTNSFVAEDADGNSVSLTGCASDVTLPGGSTFSGSSHDECTVNLAKFLHENDQIYTSSQGLQSGSAPIEGVQTLDIYTIGFNLCGDGNVTSLDSSGDQACCAFSNHNTSTGVCSSPIADPDRIKVMKAQAAVSDGEYYNANTVDELVAAFNKITSSILEKNTSFVAPSIAANTFNRLFSRDEILIGLFKPAEQTRWNGNVKKYGLCVAEDPDGDGTKNCTLGDVLDASGASAIVNDNTKADDGLFSTNAQSFWSGFADGRETTVGGAGAEITDYTQRIIYTEYEDGSGKATSGTSLSGSGYKLTSANWSDGSLSAIRDQVCPTPSTTASSECETRMLWMLGKDTENEDDEISTDTRWWFNDVLHSSPTTVTYGKDGSDNFIDKIVVGTNDGGLHFINGSTGVEEWSFMPNAILAKQPTLYTNTSPTHTYGLDTNPTIMITDANSDGTIDPSTDSVYVIIGQRRGGDNIYALDITPTTTLASTSATIVPKFAWHISPSTTGYGRLGQTWSEPQLATIKQSDGTALEVIVFGGGYDTDLDADDGSGSARNFGAEAGAPNIGNAIYMANASTGELIFSISSDAAANIVVPAMTNAIPSNITVLDSDGNGYADRLYVGDTGGQVWRVDLSAIDPGSTLAPEGDTVVGQLASLSTAAVSSVNERRFFYQPDVVQVLDSTFSSTTGGEYDYIMIGSGNRANPLDNIVTDRFYALRDYQTSPMTDSGSDGLADGYPLTAAGLSAASVISGAASRLIDVSDTILDGTNAVHTASDGWFYDFKTGTASGGLVGSTRPGEKMLSKPIVANGVVLLTTYLPDDPTDIADVCSASEGDGGAYNFNILSAAGGIDWTNDGIPDRFIELGGGIPSEVVPVFTEGGVIGIVGHGGGTATLPGVINQRTRTYWYNEH